MNRLYFLFLSLFMAICFTACTEEAIDSPSDSDPKETTEDYFRTHPGRRTIIAYITGDNNLSSNLSTDITEMTEGSKLLQSDCRLLLFADINGQTPYIANIRNGKLTKVRQYDNEFYSTSPDSMRNVMQWIINNYPSKEYSTVISGHGSGPLIKRDSVKSEYIKLLAYGYDAAGEASATSTSKWMNIPSMAMAFNNLKDFNGNKIKFSYIFFDCCCMQTAEVAYELRNCAEYIIAPLSETTGDGADYETMVSVLCAEKDDVPQAIISDYIKDTAICISAVRTDMLEALCNATRKALKKLYVDNNNPLILERKNCIYYYRGNETGSIRTPALHELKQLMKINLSAADYAEWLPYLENTVVAKHLTNKWYTSLNINFPLFQDYLTEEYYGGLCMIAPTDVYTEYGSDINTTMFQLQWCNAVDWKALGW